MTSQIPNSVIDQAALNALRELQDADDPDMLKELIGMFIGSTPERLATMRAAIASGDAKALLLAAHSLKSASANLGAFAMRSLCEQLEAVGNSGTCSGAAELLTNLETEFEKAGTELRASV